MSLCKARASRTCVVEVLEEGGGAFSPDRIVYMLQAFDVRLTELEVADEISGVLRSFASKLGIAAGGTER